MISDADYCLFQKFIETQSGIHLNASKKALLMGRINWRLRQLKLSSYRHYYCYLLEAGPEEQTILLDSISTNETHFFREPKQFELLEKRLIPEWIQAANSGQRPRTLRVWSAACSTGEEPYSLAMSLLHWLPNWRIEILATDLSTAVLEKAKRGLYSIDGAEHIPSLFRSKYMLKGFGSQVANMIVKPKLQQLIRFFQLNLKDHSYPLTGRFDIIFCRNVLMYFNAAFKKSVVMRLLGYMSPGGYLFLGHADTLSQITNRAKSVMPSVYRLPER